MIVQPMNPNIVAVAGLPDASPYHVSQTLRHLNVAHTVLVRENFVNQASTHDDMGGEQPRWPVVGGGLRLFNYVMQTAIPGTVLLVCDAASVLATTNMPVFSEGSLDHRIRTILELSVSAEFPKDWALKITEKSMHQFVEEISPPSFLDEYMTIVCKINPYDQRKLVQAACIRFLNGGPVQKTKQFLSSSLKFSLVYALVMGPRGLILRQAVQEAKTESIKVVSERHGLSEFEINYVPNAAAKLDRES